MPEEKQTRRRRSKRRRTAVRYALAALYVLLVVAASAVLATVGWNWANDLLALNKEYSSVIIEVTDDDTFPSLVDHLAKEGMIEYKFLFKLYGKFSHADQKIVAGTYELNTTMDYRALVTNMGRSSSTRQTIDITLPEGYTLDQIFAVLDSAGVSTVEKLVDMAANWNYAFDWLQDIPLGDYHRLEGYLFPDTYTFYLGEDPKYVINKMLVNFDSKMEPYFSLFEPDEEGKTKSDYTLHELVTMASLIEKETDSTDYNTIASVLYNRLENPSAETVGLLQVDAALVYVNGGHVPTLEDKEIDSPYNTYKYKGLPPGPIANPGMAALYAALEPAKTNYFFYALNPATGLHEFSRTYDEHVNRLNSYSK